MWGIPMSNPAPSPLNPALTLSRTFGSGGALLAHRLAQRLRWRCCDRVVLRQAAAALGLDAEALQAQEERPATLWSALCALLPVTTPEAPYVPPAQMPMYAPEIFALERRIMADLLARSPAVLLGRGGFVAFHGRPRTLHVYVHADLEFRVQRLLASGRVASAAEARRLAETTDRDRARFIRIISGRDWQAPGNFDLCLDPGRDGFDACEAKILAALPEACGLDLAALDRR